MKKTHRNERPNTILGGGGRFFWPSAPRLAFLTSLLSLEGLDGGGSAVSLVGVELIVDQGEQLKRKV
jgi:hypothetical protein